MMLNILKKKHSFKSDSDTTELHGESRETSLLSETYSKEHVHKENWDHNRALKCPSRKNGNTSTVLKEEALTNSEENKRKTKKRKRDQLEEIIPKKDLKCTVSETNYNCQEDKSSRLRSIHHRIIRNCRTSTSKYRVANSSKPEVELRYHLRRISARTDVRESLGSQDETDCGTPVKRRRIEKNEPITTGGTRLCANDETQPADNVHVNVIKRKRGRPRKYLPVELLTDKREKHEELKMVPAPAEKEETKLSPVSYNCKRFITNTGYNITNSFAQITMARSSDSVVGVNRSVVPYKNYTDTNKVSVVRLVRVEDMPLDQLSKLLCPKPPEQTNRACYKEEMQRSAYVSRTTRVERRGEILYRELVCKEQQINVVKESDANVNRRTNGVDASSTVGMLDGIRILKSNDNGYNSRFTLEDVLQLFLKSRNLTCETTRKSDSFKSMHTCAAMCNNCKQAFDMLYHFSSKANSKNEDLSVDLRINLLSHLQRHVTNGLLKCEGNGNSNDYPIHVVNFNKDLNKNDFRIVFACCCCSKVYRRLRFFEYHIKKCHASKIVVDGNNYKVERIVEDPRSYELYGNVRTSDEDRASDRDQIFDIASDVKIYNRRRGVNLVNHKSIRTSCINTRQVNITNSLYCDGSNSESTMMEWTMQVQEKNIILQGNDDSRGEIDETIQTVPTNEENLNTRETRHSRKSGKRSVLDVAKNDNMFACHLCSKAYRDKKLLSDHVSSYCKARMALDEQRTEDTSHSSNTSKTEEDSVDAGVTSVHDRTSTSSEEPSLPGTSGETTIANGEVDDAGNQNVERANENEALIENEDNQNLYVNLVEKSEVATKVRQSFMFNVNITRVCKRDTKGRKETENESENESSVEEETDTAQESLNDSKRWLCHECGQRFVSCTKLNNHMFSHDVASEDSESSNPLPESAFYSDVHKRYVESRLRQDNASFEKNVLNQFFKRSKKWRCDDCKENFGLLRNYLRHKYDIHGDESVVHICDNCNAIITSVKMVNLHVCRKVVTWVCERCKLYFPDGTSLMYHNLFSHFETVGPHVCETCGSTFLTDHMLTKHRTKHNGLNYYWYRNPASDTGSHSPSTSIVETQTDDDDTTLLDDSREDSEELQGLRKIFSEMCIACDANSEEVIFKCNNCSTLRPTESAMIEHLIACCRLDRCQICYATEPEYKLTEHLIQDHVVVDCSHGQGNDVQEVVDINNIIKLLGFNRLLSLYEYQKFDGDVDRIECESCKVRFSDNQLYQFHYFKNHEDVCLLCNIKFNHAVQALEHKMKIHNSYHLYLWIVQMLLLAVSRVGHYGNTIEQVILRNLVR